MRECGDIAGVLPLLDSNDEAKPNWLVTPLALPLDKHPEPSDPRKVVKLCLSLADTLAKIHARGFAHRDIKPANIFFYDNRWCLGDFGLVDFPNKEPITQDGQKVGAQYYIAPEMLNEPSKADGGKADVYSLGKLFWKLATGQKYPLPGYHDRRIPALTISAYVSHPNLSSLDGLLEAMTEVAPHQRPSMDNVATALRTWLAPIPAPSHKLDLRPYSNRAKALSEKFDAEMYRREVAQAKGEAERNRVLALFSPEMEQVVIALRQANIGSTSMHGANGGNGHFYAAIFGDYPSMAERTEFFEFSATTRITAGQRWAEFRCGFDLGIRDILGITHAIHDLSKPALASAGCIVTVTKMIDGRAKSLPQLVWSDTGTFYFGQPTEAALIARLKNGLLGNLSSSVSKFIECFETIDDRF